MEQIQKTVETQALLETYRELLTQADCLPLQVTGNSMAPFLVHRRDTVWLSAIHGALKPGDIVLYQRNSGQYILHRICRRRGQTFTLVGDAHTVVEPGIRRDQIFARVCQVRRNGTVLKPGNLCWLFFSKIWIHVIPARPALLRLMVLASNLFRRKNG